MNYYTSYMTVTKRDLDKDERDVSIVEKYDVMTSTYDLLNQDEILMDDEQTY